MVDYFVNTTVFVCIVCLIGLMVGSFLNVVIHRLPIILERNFHQECAQCLPENEASIETHQPYNLAYPRSSCPQCGHMISAFENIPVISWLCLRGRCKACATPISIRYPLVELSTAILSGLIAWQYGPSFFTLGAIIFLWFLIALIFIDTDTYLLPDDLTLPLLWLGLLFNLFTGYVALSSAVLGAVFGYLSLWSVYWIFKLLTGKEGMGYGDFKLLAALGAWLGWQSIPLIILLSSITGALLGIAMIVFKQRGAAKPIPFGPYLGIAGLIAMHWGSTLLTWYGIA